MTTKQVDQTPEASAVPVLDLASLSADSLQREIKFSPVSDEDVPVVAAIRSYSEPWRSRNESSEETLQALTQLRPFIQAARIRNQLVGYVTVERDGPVPGAAYMRNIVVKSELRRKGVGMALLQHALSTARDMHRKTLALRVDPANAPAVTFYRNAGFTTVATVVSKKSGKLRLLMSREI